MADLRLARTDDWEWDLDFTGLDLATGDDLETAIVISLLSWARRSPDDPDPAPGSDPMGWWADEILPDPNDKLGSKLWLAGGGKITPDTILQIRQWGKDALDWMLKDGVADSVNVSVERHDAKTDRLDILVVATKPGISDSFRYSLNWAAQSARST